MALKFIRQLYSLDTLDTRFFVPSNAPPKEALENAKVDPAGPVPVKDGREGGRRAENSFQPARWHTAEFYFYYVAISTCVFFMCKAVLDVSQSLSGNSTSKGASANSTCSITSKLPQIRRSAFRRLDTWAESGMLRCRLSHAID